MFALLIKDNLEPIWKVAKLDSGLDTDICIFETLFEAKIVAKTLVDDLERDVPPNHLRILSSTAVVWKGEDDWEFLTGHFDPDNDSFYLGG